MSQDTVYNGPDLAKIGFVPLLQQANTAEFLASGAAADIWKVRPISPVGPPYLYVSKVLRISAENFKHIPEYVRSTNQKSALHSSQVAEPEKFSWKAFVNEYQDKVLQWVPLMHDNVIRVYSHGQSLNLHTDFCHNGTVREALQTLDGKMKDKWDIITEVLAGLKYLHSQNPPVIHGNINAVRIRSKQ
ncbi:hypothetical protein RSOLAG22IIIB_05646 [Rhizoctonia solani]|uniref:Protein kinase domain-containing protein n=1 Tax=Rhizoctonia solani TaxID=456999 RepID=A0A0K6G7M9_9AGAM|nr:hypothetical protein RSOLAG22IIIB_05646 [Rhizoctonia solani]